MSTVTVGELQILLTVKDNASAVVAQTIKQNEQLGTSFGGVATAAKASALALVGAGTAVAGGLGLSVKVAADFEKAMSAVSAVTNASVADKLKLRDAALEAGRATVFSAQEAAVAEAELARAGISVADILGGGLRGSLDLAAAGQLDLGQAAIISAQAMNAFQLSGKDVSHIADVLAAGANKSAADVHQLGDALRQSALMANNTGLSLETTVGVLSAFADRALIGSDAGTSLKTMLGALTPNSEKAAKTMRELGIWAFDAQGNFVGLANFAEQLKTKLGNLTPEARNAALEIMFGSDAVRAGTVLYELGAAGVEEYTAAVNDSGAAQRMANEQTNNLAGAWERFKGSIQVIEIEIGEKFLPVLTRMADWAATNLPKAFDYFETEVEPKIKAFATAAAADIGQFVETVGPYLQGFGQEAQRQFARFREYYQSDLKPVLDNIVKGVEVVVQKFKDNWDTIGPVVRRLAEIFSDVTENIGNALQIVIDLLGGDWKGAWENTKQLIRGVVEMWKDTVMLGVEAIRMAVATAKDIGGDIIDGLKEGALAIWNTWVWPFFKGLPGQIKGALGDLSRLLWDVGKAIAQGLLDGLVEGAKAVWTEVSSWGGKIASLKGPLEVDRKLLTPQGYAISVSLADGLVSGFNEVVVPAVSAMAGNIKTLYDNVPAYVKRLSPAAGGDKDKYRDPSLSDPNQPSTYLSQYEGGGQYGWIGTLKEAGAPGPNGTVWDPAAQAYVNPWDVGSYTPLGGWGSGAGFQPQGATGAGYNGAPTVVINVGTLNARTEQEGKLAAGDLAHELVSRGLTV